MLIQLSFFFFFFLQFHLELSSLTKVTTSLCCSTLPVHHSQVWWSYHSDLVQLHSASVHSPASTRNSKNCNFYNWLISPWLSSSETTIPSTIAISSPSKWFHQYSTNLAAQVSSFVSQAHHHKDKSHNCQHHLPTRARQWLRAATHRNRGQLLRSPGQQFRVHRYMVNRTHQIITPNHWRCSGTIYNRKSTCTSYMSIIRPMSCHVT